jgi:hypothetical protein
MGNLFASNVNSRRVMCELDSQWTTANDNEFQVALDLNAFEFHVLSVPKSLRVTRLDLNGSWHPTDESLFTKTRPYEDLYVKIEPFDENSAKLIVKRPSEVQFLYQSARVKPRTVLCHHGNTPVVYVNMILRKQKLDSTGPFSINDNSFLLCGNEYMLLLNIGQNSNAIKPSLQQLTEKNFDPSLLYFALQPVNRHDHNM